MTIKVSGIVVWVNSLIAGYCFGDKLGLGIAASILIIIILLPIEERYIR